MFESVPRLDKLDALTLVAQGLSRAHAAALVHCSVSTIQRAKRKAQLHGDIEGGRKKRGSRPTFTPEIIDVTARFPLLGANKVDSVPWD
jgi:hypothetical protein